MNALGFDRFGGSEVLAIREVPDLEPRPGHAIVRMQAIGLNFADVYRRRGNLSLEHPPHRRGSPRRTLFSRAGGARERSC